MTTTNQEAFARRTAVGMTRLMASDDPQASTDLLGLYRRDGKERGLTQAQSDTVLISALLGLNVHLMRTFPMGDYLQDMAERMARSDS